MVTLEDGRTFPNYGAEVLSWNIGSSFTRQDEAEGNPRTLAVLRAMRDHRPEQFAREHPQLVRDTFNLLFGQVAKRLLRLYEMVRDEPREG